MKILIVDDRFEHRKLLQSWLKKYGQCDLIANGQDALELFEDGLENNAPYDLVLLDIMMPKMDGLTALRRLRDLELAFGVPGKEESVIIMVTAVATHNNVLDAYRKGRCTDFLAKPVSRKALFEKLIQNQLLRP